MTEKTPEKDFEMVEDEADETEGDGDKKQLVSKLLKDPSVLASLQESLYKYLGSPSGYIDSLPEPMRKRIKALKKIQLEYTNIEADFYKEVHALEVKYDKKHQSLYAKRKVIINGEYEPTEEECDFDLDDIEEEEESPEKLSKDLADKAKVEDKEIDDQKPMHGFDDTTKGIPEFWLTIFKNVDLLSEMLQEHDEPALKHLQDIQVKFVDEPMGFILEFHFTENEYFTNKVLTKSYEMKCTPNADDPFSFEGPEIVKCKGCTIDWKKDKNVTVRLMKKKQKHKTRTATRTITKTVPRDSFFNFFSPPDVPENEEEDLDTTIQSLLTADFEIGHYIRERIIPRAVLFFTGEALDDDDDFEEEEEGEGLDGEDCENEEDDPDYAPPAGDKQECKQQ